MKNVFRRAAAVAVFAAMAWPAGRASAACVTSIADPACGLERACQVGILKAAIGYNAAVQSTLEGFIAATQKGSLKAAPPFHCVGGPAGYPGKACLANNGVCKAVAGSPKGKYCSIDADCGGVAGACDHSVGKACNIAGSPDVGECQVNDQKAAYAGAIAKAQTKLNAAIQTACVVPGVTAADLGVDQLDTTCPGVAGPGLAEADRYNALADCIKHTIGGDFASGGLVETEMFSFAAATGTNAIAPNSVANKTPRMIEELAGSSALQIGNGAGDPTSNNVTASGALTLVSLAHCVGGNTNVNCINNADCGTDTAGMPGTCTSNAAGGYGITLTGPQPVHVGGPNPPPDGNTLTETGTCAGGVATCLVTHTKNAGNGTAASGSVGLTSGNYTSTSPIVTDVYVTGVGVTCPNFPNVPSGSTVACPVCNAGICSNNGLLTCTAATGAVTIECPPPGVTTIHVPNPFTLNTASITMLPAQPGLRFCGFCDTNGAAGCQGGPAMCAVGCQVLGDCAANAPTATVCDFGSTIGGFHGNTGTATISTNPIPSQYAPLAEGLFCTGQTGNPVVDGAAGLPGPVRSINPYLFGYIQTKD